MRYLTTCFVFLSGLVLSGQSLSDSAFVRQHYEKFEYMIPMRDGARLHTAVYAPRDKSRKYPFLINRTPYSCRPYGPEAYRNGFQNMKLARSGYIFVFQDVRGRYMSEGEFVDVRPFLNIPSPPNTRQKTQQVDEATDTYDTVEWLLRNVAGHNGKVGVYGISYPGFYATMSLLARHPAIAAVSPQAPVTDWFIGDDFHHNGAFMLMDAFSFYSGFGKPRPKPTTEGNPGFSDWRTPDNYQFFLKAGALRNFSEKYGMADIPFWQELMQHPNYDAWWRARTPLPHLINVKAAVLTVGGLFDAEDTWGAWNTYKAVERQNTPTVSNSVVMGPWVHGGWSRTQGDRLGNVSFGKPTTPFYQDSVEFPFFEYHLKGSGTLSLPEALVFETGANRWLFLDAWPPPQTRERVFFFEKNKKLSDSKPAANAANEPINLLPLRTDAYSQYVSDPDNPVPYTEDVHLRRTREYMTDDQRFADRRPDVLSWQTDVLDKEIRVAGPIEAEIWFSTTGTDADLVVKVIDVFPDTLRDRHNGVPLGGYQMLVRGEIFRGRYRNGFDKPEAFVPGEPTLVRFELPDIAHAFKPGHRLMIQVQSSWFPLADRNPQQFINIYEARDEDFIPAVHRIWHSETYPSGVRMKVWD